MNEEEKKAALEEAKKNIEQTIEQKVVEKTAETLKSMVERLDKTEKELEEKTETIKKLGEERKETKEIPVVTVVDAFLKALKENVDAIKGIKGKASMMNLTCKTVGDITRANVSSLTPFYNLDTEINLYPQRKPFLRNIINVGSVTGPGYGWYEEGAGEGDAGMTDENTPKNKRDKDWTWATMPVQKITDFTKVSEEALEDISFIEDAIRTDLMNKLALKEDAMILSGSGTGTPTQLKGILTYATAFSVTNSVNPEFYLKVQGANELDVLRTAISIIAKSQGTANVICLNPADVALMDMQKTANGAYILPPFTTADGTKFRGCYIIENTGITAGTFLVMDSTKSNYKIRKDTTLAIGYDADDFTNNRITIRGELRGVHFIKANDVGCFIYGTFTACIAMITSGVGVQGVSILSPLNEAETAIQTTVIE